MSTHSIHRIGLLALVCLLVPSCMSMFEGGREVQRLRELHAAQTMKNNNLQGKLRVAQEDYNKLNKEVTTLRNKIRKREEALRAQQAQLENDAELQALKNQLEQTESQMESAGRAIREGY